MVKLIELAVRHFKTVGAAIGFVIGADEAYELVIKYWNKLPTWTDEDLKKALEQEFKNTNPDGNPTENPISNPANPNRFEGIYAQNKPTNKTSGILKGLDR